MALQLLSQLKVAEKSLMLSVSSSVVEDFNFLNPKIKFHVIDPGNAINLDKFSIPSQDVKYDAIFFARLIPEKGLYDLPIIWKHVTEKNPQAKLCVAGITENRKFISQFLDMVNELCLSENIFYLGMLEENTLISTIKSSKLTIYPSLVDSFSLVTLESLACGTPVVAYDISAIRHNFSKCDAVIRCPIKNIECMAEQTLSIIKNEKLKETLSEKAKNYSAKYDWINIVRAEKEAYFKVVDYMQK